MTYRRIHRLNHSCRSNRSSVLLAGAFLAAATAALGAQNAYQGVSTPPPDDTIQTSSDDAPHAKPSPAHRRAVPQPAPEDATPQSESSVAQPSVAQPPAQPPADDALPTSSDSDIVQIEPARPAPQAETQPGLNRRDPDPDGDIVHPGPHPGELAEGTTIRVRLLDRLSTAETARGEAFRTRVMNDVVQDGQVLIPAGAEIDGHVAKISSGTLGGYGSMNLRPETVILPDGSRFRLYAQLTGAPGTHTRIRSEGAVTPDSRAKRDAIEYGGTVGAGAVTGAVLGGPAGALAGALVGAGVVSAHLLISHPQATLDAGTALVFSLTEPLNLQPAASGN